jgi:hypothetical protein
MDLSFYAYMKWLESRVAKDLLLQCVKVYPAADPNASMIF